MTIEAIVFDAHRPLYDVRSVARVTEAEFPGRGDDITPVSRVKQLDKPGCARSWCAARFDRIVAAFDLFDLHADANGSFKPNPRADALVERRLGLPPEKLLFGSSNGFAVAGARSYRAMKRRDR